MQKTTIIMTTELSPAEVLAKLGLVEATVAEATVPVTEKPPATKPKAASKPPAETAAKDDKPQRKSGGGGRRKSNDDKSEFWSIETDEKQNGRMVIKRGMVKKNDNEIAVAVVESTDTHYRLAFIAKTGKCAYSNTVWKVKVAELQEECEATVENALMMKVMF